MPVRIKEIRKSAEGQRCTIQIPGVCNNNPETTVFAHYGEPGEKGVGLKPDDSSGAYACSACHDALDGRVPWTSPYPATEKQDFWFRGMRRTWRQLLLNDVLTTGRSGTYNQGAQDMKEIILCMVSSCTMRDPTLQKLQKAIEDL